MARLQTKATIRDKNRGGRRKSALRAEVSELVIACLGGRKGNKLLFDEGCEEAVARAKAAGRPFFVVRLANVPGVRLRKSSEVRPADVARQAEEVGPPEPAPSVPRLEPIAEAVRAKLGGR